MSQLIPLYITEPSVPGARSGGDAQGFSVLVFV